MTEDNINNEFGVDDDFDDDDVKYCLTPWGCLYATLTDFGIDVDHITGRVGELLVEDFMEAMQKAGYVSKAPEED